MTFPDHAAEGIAMLQGEPRLAATPFESPQKEVAPGRPKPVGRVACGPESLV